MQEYQKIETLYKFDNETKEFKREFYNPIVEYLKDCPWYGTEKIDGTNIRIGWDGHRFTFGGRTAKANIPKEIMQLLVDTFNYDMEIAFEQKFGEKEVILFMEGYAGKIQGGVYSGPEKLIGFDVMINGIYLDKKVAKKIFYELGLDFVPLLTFANLQVCVDYVQSHSLSNVSYSCKMEGLVCCPVQRIYDHMGNRIIVKIKRKDLGKLEGGMSYDQI